MTTETTTTLLTARQVAERLQVTRHRVYELIRERRIPGVVRIGRQVRVDPEPLEEWIASGGSADTDPSA